MLWLSYKFHKIIPASSDETIVAGDRLFCFDGWAFTLFVLIPCRFFHFRTYN